MAAMYNINVFGTDGILITSLLPSIYIRDGAAEGYIAQ